MQKGYLLEKKHYSQDIDFKLLKEYTDNIILEYDPENVKQFRRFLFGMDECGYNIGILVAMSVNGIEDFFKAIAGFKINLGVWESVDNENYSQDILDAVESHRDNFIFGFRSNTGYTYYPSWCPGGDIESTNMVMLPELYNTATVLNLNTDYKTIYEENNLKPIKSNYGTEDVLVQ